MLTSSQATLNENGTVTVEFELKTCHRHFVAVWLVLDDGQRTPIVYVSPNIRKRNPQLSSSIFQVPKDCLTKRGNIFSLNWPSPARRSCSFPLIQLLECRVYSIEIIPIFQGFQGQPSTASFTVPPRVTKNSYVYNSFEIWSNLKKKNIFQFPEFWNNSMSDPPSSLSVTSLEAVSRSDSSNGINIKWSVESQECAQLISSVDVRIYDNAVSSPLRSYSVPSYCFGKTSLNSFTIDTDYCNSAIIERPLELCRYYKLELEPKYSSTWNGRSSIVDFFAAGVDNSSTKWVAHRF